MTSGSGSGRTEAASRRVRLLISGRVQGVFYRASAREKARTLRLLGFVRNLPDGSVESVAEGPEPELREYLAWCRRGPSGAKVEKVEEEWSEFLGEFAFFEVRH